MRDYKHVKVPRRYRETNRRSTVRRVETAGLTRRSGGVKASLGSVVVTLLTAALCYGAWTGYRWLTTAEMFQVAGIDVHGANRLGENDVREIAKLFTNQNIFRVDMAAAAQRALANPWVRDVRIDRRLPNRISMQITERKPRAVLLAANGAYLMDGDGTVITPAPQGAALPVIAMKDVRAVPRSAPDGDGLPAAFALLDEIEKRGGWNVADLAIRADAAETVTVVYGGHEFRIGGSDYPEKLRRLGEIVSDMNRRGVEYTYVELRPERQAAVMVAKAPKDRGKGQGSRGKGKQRKG